MIMTMMTGYHSDYAMSKYCHSYLRAQTHGGSARVVWVSGDGVVGDDICVYVPFLILLPHGIF
jgi:hypothetical protein